MKNTGDGRRIAKVEREVQAVVAQYIIGGFRYPLPGIVTLARLHMPPDLKHARVYINVFGSDADKVEAVKILNRYRRDIQSHLAKKLAIRYTPTLEFFVDEGPEQMIHITNLLKTIKRNPQAGSDSEHEQGSGEDQLGEQETKPETETEE